MKITIISSNTNVGKKNLSRIAWELSRTPDDTTPLDTILSIDAPVNEIPSVVLSIECTILEREIFASFRDHVMWARTSRVDAPENFEIPKYFNNIPDHVDAKNFLKDKIKKDISNNIIQDEYRMHMPVCSLTSFTTRLSWRGLIKIYKLYEYLSQIDVYFIIGKNELNNKFQLEKYAKNYSFVNPIPEVRTNEMQTGRIGPIINVFLNMTIALRAQVVRHRNFTIKDNLMSIIKKRNWFTTLGHKININIAAETEFWKTVINKRQCWIAQYGIWKEIIVAAQKYIDISEKDLPCNKGFCPYTRDAELRHTDNDPGAPCPIHSNLASMPIDKKYMPMVNIEASYRPNFWKKHINNVEVIQ